MPQKIEAITFVDDPSRSLEQLQTACREAGLDSTGSADVLRERLQQRAPEIPQRLIRQRQSLAGAAAGEPYETIEQRRIGDFLPLQ